MFTIVDDDQRGSPSQIPVECVLANIEDLCCTGTDHIGIRQARQFDEPDPVRIVVYQRHPNLLRQPGLAGASGAKQRDQAGRGKQAGDFFDLSLLADEAGHLHGKIVWMSIQGV